MRIVRFCEYVWWGSEQLLFFAQKARTLIKQHATLFNVLEKDFEIITELFSVQIPASEMGYVIEIFLPYCQQNEQS